MAFKAARHHRLGRHHGGEIAFERRVAGDKRIEFLIREHGFYVHAK